MPLFDPQSLPVLSRAGPPTVDAALNLVLDDALGRPMGQVETQVEQRGNVTLVRVVGWDAQVSTHLGGAESPAFLTLLDRSGVVTRRAVLLSAPPDKRPNLASLRASVLQLPPDEAARRLAAALPTLPPESALWLSVDLARLRAQAGGEAAITAWEDAAALARAQGVPTEVSRRLRAAAAVAIRQRAFERAGRVLDAARAADGPDLPDGQPANPAGLVRLEVQLAYRDKAVGDFRLATEHLEDAVRRARELGLDADWASAGQALATLLQDQGRHHAALELLAQVQAFYDKNPDAPDGGATLRNNAGWILRRAMAEGAMPFDARRLSELFDAALKDARKHGDWLNEAVARSNRTWAALDAGDLDAAERARGDWQTAERLAPAFSGFELRLTGAELALRRGQAGAALAEALEIGRVAEEESQGLVSDGLVEAHHIEARARVALGQRTEARARYGTLLTELRALALRTDLQGDRSPFLARRRSIHDEATALALVAGDLADAFDHVDEASSPALQSLRQQLARERMPPDERAAVQTRIQAWLVERDAVDALAARRRVAADDERPALDVELTRRRAALARDFDTLGSRLAPRSGARPSEVAKVLPPRHALLLFYTESGRPAAFRAAGGRITHFDPGVGPEALFARLRVACGDDLLTYIVPGDVPAARTLVDAWPERGLAQLPFAAFFLDTPDAPVGQMPDPRPTQALPIGDPSGNLPHARRDVDAAVGQMPDPRPTHALLIGDPSGNLPHARREVETISAWLGVGPGRRVLLGEDATRANVLSALQSGAGPPTLLHFAGHGILSAESAWDAHLALAAGGRLTVADVLALRAPLARVILDGCQTGSGVDLSATEQVSLADAFLLAGAGTVIATTREIDDALARSLLVRFYADGGAARPLDALHLGAEAWATLRGAPLAPAFADGGFPLRAFGRVGPGQ